MGLTSVVQCTVIRLLPIRLGLHVNSCINVLTVARDGLQFYIVVRLLATVKGIFIDFTSMSCCICRGVWTVSFKVTVLLQEPFMMLIWLMLSVLRMLRVRLIYVLWSNMQLLGVGARLNLIRLGVTMARLWVRIGTASC